MADIAPDDDLTLLTCAEMGAADAAAIAGGVSGTALMEAAGRAVSAAVVARYPRKPVAVLCGPGNNGGDGFVAARRLQEAGWPVRLGLLGAPSALKGDAAWAAGTWRGATEKLTPALLHGNPIVIDAMFGAGLSRPIEGVAAELIAVLNERKLRVVAVDVPSGLHGDTGEVLGCAPHADVTVTFFRAKPGHLSLEGLRRCGELKVVDIGIPKSVLQAIGPRQWRDGPALWRHLLRRDGFGDNKYVRGHLTILGGGTATGAARLAALAARRVGAGLVTIASPASAMAVYQSAEPGNLVVEASDDRAFGQLLQDQRRNAVLIGPGSGVNERTRQAVLAALAARRSAVLDADAITSFAREPADLFKAIAGPVLLTPHEGEFKRLFPSLGTDTGKLARVREAAHLSGATVLLKGPDTVIAGPDGRAVINVHAPASLATAGSGDVLAGLAAGLMAQGLAPLAAAAAAAWLHGECAYRFGRPGLIAEDIVDFLPEALAAAMN
ncbi:MAG TPA: NAD(P)H-hydrate dehydratase [Reyranella sp.]|nr:NAD(P)H-hydrate dehydratase [Reyranella sp.]